MKKIFALLLAAILLLGLCACGETDNQQGSSAAEFKVGFGKADVTPKKPIHMMSYSDPATHISEGAHSSIMALAMVLQGANGNTMVMISIDTGTVSNNMLNQIRPLIEERYGIDKEHVTISCPHNHNGPAYGYADTYDQQWKEEFHQGILDAVGQGIEDLAPATIEIGRTETENLTFVRRYHLADGSMTGDNFNYDHNSTIISHESEADEEVQLVRFVRQGDKKDVIVVNWQSHAAKQGNSNFLSADYVGALRDKVEKDLDAYCIYFQGAAGNLNPVSRIESENTVNISGYAGAVAVGEKLAEYVVKACTTEGVMQRINGTEVNNKQDKFIAKQLWAETNFITVGQLSFITMPAEFFDSLGMMIKEGTPYEMTILMGYSCGGDGCYLPDERGFEHGGYEVNKSMFRKGEGEKFVQYYLDGLNAMYHAENP